MSSRREATLPADPIVEFFNRRAADYDQEYGQENPGGYALRIRRQKVLKLFDQAGGRVLDVGCGPAVMTQDLLERGCSFWGVDPSSRMIEICRSRYQENDRVQFRIGDAQRLDFQDGFFDAVLCMGVIDSIRDRSIAVREMLRVLKPGGTLILTITNRHNPYAWWKNYIFYPLVTLWHDRRARRGDPTLKAGRRRSGKTRAIYSRRAAYDLLAAEGAEIVARIGYYYNVFISPLDELLPSTALRVTRKIEESWSAPEWMAAGLILKSRKINQD